MEYPKCINYQDGSWVTIYNRKEEDFVRSLELKSSGGRRIFELMDMAPPIKIEDVKNKDVKIDQQSLSQHNSAYIKRRGA